MLDVPALFSLCVCFVWFLYGTVTVSNYKSQHIQLGYSKQDIITARYPSLLSPPGYLELRLRGASRSQLLSTWATGGILAAEGATFQSRHGRAHRAGALGLDDPLKWKSCCRWWWNIWTVAFTEFGLNDLDVNYRVKWCEAAFYPCIY